MADLFRDRTRGHLPVRLLSNDGYAGTSIPAPKNCLSIDWNPGAHHSDALDEVHAFYRREISMLQDDELQTFEQVVLPHLDAAYNLARWLMRSDQDAQDVAQEAYLRAFRFFPGFRGGDARAWLLKIVRNNCYTLMHANRHQRDAIEFDEGRFSPDSRPLNPEEAVLQSDNGAMVRKALEQLPVNAR